MYWKLYSVVQRKICIQGIVYVIPNHIIITIEYLVMPFILVMTGGYTVSKFAIGSKLTTQ